MSDLSTVTTARTALASLQSTPLWVLTGVTASLTVAKVWPAMTSALPDFLATHIDSALVVSGILTACKASSVVANGAADRRRAALKRDQKRFSKIYRPLACLFTTRHIEVCSGIGAPTIRHRLRNARRELVAYRKPLVGLQRAICALGDRRRTTSAAMSLGGSFPMAPIIKRVHANAQYADDKLLSLMRRADHSAFETRDDSLLTADQLALFLHIAEQNAALASRLG